MFINKDRFSLLDSQYKSFYYHFKTTRERRRWRGSFLNFLRCSFPFGTHSQKNTLKKKENFSAFLHILNPSRILMNPAFSLKKIEGHFQLTDLQRVTHISQLQGVRRNYFLSLIIFWSRKVEGIDLIRRHHFKKER